MKLPVSFVGLGNRALDLVTVRARQRMQTADLLVADSEEVLALAPEGAERMERGGLAPLEVAAFLRQAYEAGGSAVRAVPGAVGESMHALDEIRTLLEGNIPVEVIGATAQDTLRWPWQGRLPLGKRTIAVTRISSESDAFGDLLRRLGAEVIEAPTHVLAPPDDPAPFDLALDQVGSYSYVVITSVVGAHRFVDRLFTRGWDTRALAGVRLAAIGTGTAKALQARGLKPDLIPAEHRGEALATELLAKLPKGGRVLIARAQDAREVLPRMLHDGGAHVEVAAVYRSVPLPPERLAPLKEKLAAKQVDAIAFASGSAARALLGAVGNVELLSGVALACLGPVTAQALTDLGLPVAVQAPTATFEQLAEALCRYFAGRRR